MQSSSLIAAAVVLVHGIHSIDERLGGVDGIEVGAVAIVMAGPFGGAPLAAIRAVALDPDGGVLGIVPYHGCAADGGPDPAAPDADLPGDLSTAYSCEGLHACGRGLAGALGGQVIGTPS